MTSVPEISPEELEKKKRAAMKSSSFDKEVKALIKQSLETLQSKYSNMGEDYISSRKEWICLTKYQNLYLKMSPEEHYTYFESLFQNHRAKILNILENDALLREEEINVQFGEGKRDLLAKSQLIKIPLSAIYRIALEIQISAEKTLEGLEIEPDSKLNKDLIRPNIILLHLCRIFYHLNVGETRTQVGKIVDKLEEQLGILQRTTAQDVPVQQSSGGISAIFNLSKDLMTKLGFAPPPDLKLPSDQDVNNAFSSIFSNPEVTSTMEKVFNGLKQAPDVGTAIKTVVNSASDPETMQQVNKTFESVKATFANTVSRPTEAGNQPAPSEITQ